MYLMFMCNFCMMMFKIFLMYCVKVFWIMFFVFMKENVFFEVFEMECIEIVLWFVLKLNECMGMWSSEVLLSCMEIGSSDGLLVYVFLFMGLLMVYVFCLLENSMMLLMGFFYLRLVIILVVFLSFLVMFVLLFVFSELMVCKVLSFLLSVIL